MGRSKGFFSPACGGHLIHLFLFPSPSITARGCTIYRAYISCLFRYRTFSKPLQKESELEMNLRPKQQLSLPPPCPQAGSIFLPGCGSPGPQAPPTPMTHHHPPKTVGPLAPAHGTGVEQCSKGQGLGMGVGGKCPAGQRLGQRSKSGRWIPREEPFWT